MTQVERKRRQLRLLIAGITSMVGGEAFCIFGPLDFPHLVHIACHAVFYSGVVLCAAAAILLWTAK